MRNIPDKLLGLSTLISIGDSSGSGFMYSSKKHLYLVTARHVLFDETKELRNTEIEITCQTVDPTDDSVSNFLLDLTKLEHVCHKQADVCVVKIGVLTEQRKESAILIKYLPGTTQREKGFSKPMKASRDSISLLDEILISNDVYIFGYPTSLGLKTKPKFDYLKPLLRKGIVASVNKKEETIILDCPVYFGNSGGPVVQVVIDESNEKVLTVIGVISEYIPYVQHWYNGRDKLENVEYLNSGYSVATSLNPVLDIIELIES